MTSLTPPLCHRRFDVSISIFLKPGLLPSYNILSPLSPMISVHLFLLLPLCTTRRWNGFGKEGITKSTRASSSNSASICATNFSSTGRSLYSLCVIRVKICSGDIIYSFYTQAYLNRTHIYKTLYVCACICKKLCTNKDKESI